jgi:hypothetical protein
MYINKIIKSLNRTPNYNNNKNISPIMLNICRVTLPPKYSNSIYNLIIINNLSFKYPKMFNLLEVCIILKVIQIKIYWYGCKEIQKVS